MIHSLECSTPAQVTGTKLKILKLPLVIFISLSSFLFHVNLEAM